MDVGGTRKACTFLLPHFLMCGLRCITELPESPGQWHHHYHSCDFLFVFLFGDFPKFSKSARFMLESSLFYVGTRSVCTHGVL